jgi:hypothetical protein
VKIETKNNRKRVIRDTHVVGRRTETGSPEVLTKRKGDGGRKGERSGSGMRMGRRINALRLRLDRWNIMEWSGTE